MQYKKIDMLTGMFVTDVITNDPTQDMIIVPVPDGLYWPKWDFATEMWVEGATQEYIDSLLASQVPSEPTTDEVLDNLITTLVDKGVLY